MSGTRQNRAPRRVLHLIDTSVVHPYLLSFAVHGDRRRYEYTFATLGSAGPLHERIAQASCRSLALGADARARYPLAGGRLLRFLAGRRFDVVQTHLFDPSAIGLACASAARVPVRIFTAHHVAEWAAAGLGSPRAARLDGLVRRRLATQVIAPSEYLRDLLLADPRTAATRVSVIHHGIERGEWQRPGPPPGTVRAELGIGQDLVVAAVGRISPVKNYPAMVRAFAAVARRHPTLGLLIVGAGATEPLIALARELGVAGQVHCIGGSSRMTELIHAFDFLLHPSLTEAFGLVILEALSAGVPVVSSPVGIAPNLVQTGATGVLLSGSSEAEIRAGLTEMVELRDRWEAMGREASRRTEAYTSASMVAAHERLYERLLDGRR